MGNSGGALVDIKGELLGINTAIFQSKRRKPGCRLRDSREPRPRCDAESGEKGRVVRGYIGASVQTLTPELAEAMKLKGQPTALW